tara:strand:+ start:68775 stop:70499 length:1725 start_codon:yes stop_codon:yes gene_type:complete
MYILGINAFHGDSSASLLKDGEIICAVEEERFRRIKHWAGFPSESIKFCLEDSGISIDDIDYITISRDPKSNFLKKILYSIKYRMNISTIIDRTNNFFKVNSIKKLFSEEFNIPINKINAKFFNIEHHRSHMASAFFASEFKDSAILSIDGFGDFTSTMYGIGKGNKIKVMNCLNYPHSLGLFYTAATQFLGFEKFGDEYKIMGLSSYGDDKYCDQLSTLVKISKDGFFKLNPKFFKHFRSGVSMNWENGCPNVERLFTKEWERIFFRSRNANEEIKKHHIDFASSVQLFTEKIVFNILNEIYHRTKIDSLCFAGGVSQNSVLNGKIIQNTPFKNIYVPSAGHDAGTSIGSALYLYNHILNNKRGKKMITSFFGKKSNNYEIIKTIDQHNIPYKKLDYYDMIDYVSDQLVKGKVVGWFQGRAEFGPRSLGNRSILVDPRREDAKELLNSKIKRREGFRPFAPSILEDFVGDYFDFPEEVPFMEKVLKIKSEKYGEIPAVTHVDGTGRLQTVNKKSSPKFYDLINSFYKKTGVPILLNTSFNENEPIVNLPEHALDCFVRTKMDILVMEDIIVER